jgi:hypothetical protein
MDKKPKEHEAEKVILIPDADKSALGKGSPITNKESELEWVKHPPRRKPGQ